MPLLCTTSATSGSNVAGGHTSRSHRCGSLALATRSWASATPSRRSPFIFQLPATSLLRSAISVPALRLVARLGSTGEWLPLCRLPSIHPHHDHTGTGAGQPAATSVREALAKTLRALI